MQEPTPKTALVWDGSRPTPAAPTAAQPGPSTGDSQGGTAVTTPQDTSPPASETTSLTALLNPSLIAVIHATKDFTLSLDNASILANIRSMGHGGTWFPASNPTAQQHQAATPSACATHTDAPSSAAAAADPSTCATADKKKLEAAALLLDVGRLWKLKKQQLAQPNQAAAAAVGGAVTVPGASSSGGTSDRAVDPAAGVAAAVDKSSAAGDAGGSGSRCEGSDHEGMQGWDMLSH